MKTNKIQWRNISSYGEETQTIDLTGDPAFYLLIGKNGAGKSAISNVIKYGWYGRVDGIFPKDVANRTNKNGWIRIEGQAGGKIVAIERTVSPNGMSLWVDDIPYDKARYRGQGPSEYLTEELMDFPYHVFNNVSTLSINDFKSLITMGAKDKRDIVDRVLGYHVVNVMREILSKEIKTLRDAVLAAGVRLDQATTQLNRNRQALEVLMESINQTQTVEGDRLAEELEKFKQVAVLHEKNVTKHQADRQAARKVSDSLAFSRTNKTRDIDQIQKDLNLLAQAKCPTCGVDMQKSEFHDHARIEMTALLAKTREQQAEIESAYKEALEQTRATDLVAAELTTKGAKINTKMQEILKELQKIKTGDERQTTEIQRLIDASAAEVEDLATTRSRNESKMSWVKTLEEAVGDNGIKRLAMQRVVPAFNAQIARMMSEMHLDYTVTFDEEFDAKITHFKEEIQPGTLSFGESKKVDFVVLAAWIRLIKMKYPGLNVLFLDEIFASVDADGIHSILQILHGMCKDLRLNIFVISHNNLPQEVFDYKIYVNKENGFSRIRIAKD